MTAQELQRMAEVVQHFRTRAVGEIAGRTVAAMDLVAKDLQAVADAKA